MNKTLGTLAVTLGLAIGGQEALATNKTVELGKSKVGDTTEEVRGDVQNCIGKGQFKLSNGECATMVYLVDESPKTTTPIKEEISQLQKRGNEMQREELFKFWGLAGSGLLGISAAIGGLISLLTKNSRNLDDEQSLNELLNELKENFASINDKSPNSFLSLHIAEFTKIEEELSLCVKSISELGDADSKEIKSIISRLEKLKKKIELLDKKFKKENKYYLNRIEIEEALR